LESRNELLVSFGIFLFGAGVYLLQPLALLFGLAVAVPIIIHFWNRHRHRPMEWAATHYLMLAMQKASARITFQQLVLLCVRVLIVGMLAIALAGPYSSNGISVLNGGAPKAILHVFVIDRSYSMQMVQDEKSSLERAKSIALSIVQDANHGDGFLVFAADTNLIPSVGEPVADKNLVSSEIELISASNTVLNPIEVFRQLSKLSVINDSTLFGEIRIHMISDYSAVDWLPSDEERSSEHSNGVFSELKNLLLSVASVQFHPIPKRDVSNNFVTKIEIEKPKLLLGKPFQCKVQIENSRSLGTYLIDGNEGAKTYPQKETVVVEILIDNETVGSKTVLIPPNGKASVAFDLQISRVGEMQIEAKISSDALLVDNRRYKIVEAVEKQDVLFVESKRGVSRFLQFALEPNELARSDFRFVVVDPKSLADEVLGNFQFVFVDNVRGLSDTDVVRLRRFAGSGGSVVIFLGDQVDRTAFNQAWKKPVDELPTLPVELLGVAGVDNYRINVMAYLSPMLRTFRGNEDSGLNSMPIWNYYRTRIDDPSLTRIDLTLENGDPLLVTCKMGSGQCILFTSSSSSLSRSSNNEKTSWNANEAWPAFPPLIQEIFQSGSQFDSVRSFQVGDAIFGELERDELMEELSVRYANGDKLDARWQQSDGIVTWSSDPMDRPGVVSVESKTREEESTQKFSVNVSTQESQLESISPIQDSVSENESSDQALSARSQFQGYQLLLIGLVGLLLFETTLSQRFGRSQ
jgi:hypothetical protein